MRALRRLAVACAALGATACAQVSVTRIDAPTIAAGLESAPPPAAAPGELRIPAHKGRAPAVLILHGSSGVDGRGGAYAQALNAAGVATLEIDMWRARGLAGGPAGRPKSVRETWPDAYGSLAYLAARDDIDPNAIGVMGFSWGGIMALSMASADVTHAYTGGELRFAAHAPLYPVCWLSAPGGPLHSLASGAWTGAPVFLQYGLGDDYERPDACERMRASLPPANQALLTMKGYPGAEHGWDSVGGARTVFDPSGNEGAGGDVTLAPDAAIAAESREAIVDFFVRTLKQR